MIRKLYVDKMLLLFVAILSIFSLVMIMSIGVPTSLKLSAESREKALEKQGVSYNADDATCNDPGIDCYRLFKTRLLHLCAAIVALFIAFKVPYRFWKKTAPVWFIGAVIFLFIVLVIGSKFTTFARSWLVIFNTSLQPTEFAKLALIFYLAYWLDRKTSDIGTLQNGFIPFCVITGLIIIPVLVQPDVGGVLILTIIAVSMYFVAGARLRHLALGGLIVMIAGFLIVSVLPHVQKRFTAFLNQNAKDCAQTNCWHTKQSNIAVGTGGFWGKGLTQGVQKSYWLPQPTDDFIFAASAEELGFIRIIFVVVAYALIAYRGYIIAYHAPNRFTMLIAVGITSWITLQAFLNIAINIGLMPVTGITLPFISHGGSSLVSSFIGIGILLHISQYSLAHAPSPGRRRNRGTHHSQYSTYSGA